MFPFFLLAQLLYTLFSGTHPAPSVSGIAWLTATLVAMLLLAFGKRMTGRQLKNEVLLTEGKVTLVDSFLHSLLLLSSWSPRAGSSHGNSCR